ncbi:beta-glucanase (GH16 family) [Streptomyces sp. SLBN-118]|uniref:family 16 glycosylhydrolase n=1 Tax=Streptomyces sp. SLBN-118 TaxID=2768454 RepID=UPI00115021F6|nr:family 16 glycosylhydrolase [Streptomyces sp. SLBN-118]TQK44078.1 beta-glucanase (GH16 family) [Streptomyces sp. SLBN-118]
MKLPLRSRRTCAAMASVLAVLAVGFGPSTARAAPPSTDEWAVEWTDDFGGGAGTAPDSKNWITDVGTGYPGGPAQWGTGEVQRYTNDPANLSQDGHGNLRITPLRDSAGRWTSGRIETRRSDFRPADGKKLRIEARLQLPGITGPAAAGYWPAFWTLGRPFRTGEGVSPTVGEFDVLENANGVNRVWGAMHCGTSTGGPCEESTGLNADTACPGSECTGHFHTYAVEWDRSVEPERLTWSVDGRPYHSVSSAQINEATWDAATGHGHFILLDLAIGGGFPKAIAGHSTPTPNTRPGSPMLVDHVTVRTTGGSD